MKQPRDTRSWFRRLIDAIAGRTWAETWHLHIYAGEQCFNCGSKEIEYAVGEHKVCRACFKSAKRLNPDSGAKEKQRTQEH